MGKNSYFFVLLFLLLVGIILLPTTVSQAQGCGAGETTHIIQSGQNLFRIALGYGVSMDAIAQRNNLSDITRIFTSDILCIPGGGTFVPSSPPATNGATTVSNTPSDGGEYNWCSDPSVWGDGRCDAPGLSDCYWKMGWYLPRAAAGEFSISDIATPCMGTIASVTVREETNPSTGCKYLVVVLNGSPFTGKANVNVDSDHFDGGTQSTGKCDGLAIHGNDNSNIIIGSPGNDRIYGYGGADLLVGDSITGDGSGDDEIDGGSGVDLIYGDSIIGNGTGNDTINGGDNADLIWGDSTQLGSGSGDDTIDGGNGFDIVNGPGNDGDTLTNVEFDRSTGDN